MTTMSCECSSEAITGEGRVSLRRAPVDLGLSLSDPAAKTHAAGLCARGKTGRQPLAIKASRQAERSPRSRFCRAGQMPTAGAGVGHF
jgi:hypothetical protein